MKYSCAKGMVLLPTLYIVYPITFQGHQEISLVSVCQALQDTYEVYISVNKGRVS